MTKLMTTLGESYEYLNLPKIVKIKFPQ